MMGGCKSETEALFLKILASLPISSLYATVWPATYLGQYQIFCGIPGDEWAVHVTVKDAETGEVISETDFPTRDE